VERGLSGEINNCHFEPKARNLAFPFPAVREVLAHGDAAARETGVRKYHRPLGVIMSYWKKELLRFVFQR